MKLQQVEGDSCYFESNTVLKVEAASHRGPRQFFSASRNWLCFGIGDCLAASAWLGLSLFSSSSARSNFCLGLMTFVCLPSILGSVLKVLPARS